MEPQFDARWRKRALRGDAAAVAELAGFALKPLYRFCYYRLAKDRHLCEDVVQETLVRAIRDLANYEPDRSGGSIFPWLTGLARNEIRRVLAHRQAASLEALWTRIDRELLEVYARLESEPFGQDVLERAETREMVNAAMSQLPPQYACALEAKYFFGKSVREIASGTDSTEKAVESLLTRARSAFKATFVALARNLPEMLEQPQTRMGETPVLQDQ